MTRPSRTEMLAEADLDMLERLADAELVNAEVRVHKLPSAELAHMQFRDPVQGQPFFLGEVLFHLLQGRLKQLTEDLTVPQG
jgi:alpha-D-ribose 1-methylphosphonate 5-triphosphate synthase subunit PhnG